MPPFPLLPKALELAELPRTSEGSLTAMRINMRTNNSQAQRDNPACEERDFRHNRLIKA